MKRMVLLLALMLSAVVLCASCSTVSIGTDRLMKSPVYAGESGDRIAAVQKQKGDITLLYPEIDGAYRCDFMLGDDTAAVFYQTADGLVEVAVLQYDSRWRYTYSIVLGADTLTAAGVQSLGGNDRLLLTTETDAKQTLWLYDVKGQATPIASVVCEDYCVGDFASKNENQLLVLRDNTAVLYQVDHTLTALSDVTLRSAKTDEQHLLLGQLYAGKTALFIDRVSSDTTATDVIYFHKDKLHCLGDMTRTGDSRCMDVNADGIVEVPDNQPMPGYEQSKHAPLLTYYQQWQEGEWQTVLCGHFDYENGTYLAFADHWVGNVSVVEHEDGMRSYCIYDDENEKFSVELVRTKVYSKADFDPRQTGVIVLHRDDDCVVAARLMSKLNKYALTQEQLTNRFGLLP